MSAFKNKETQKKNFLGVLKGEIQNEEGRTGPATDETVLAILKKMEKSLSSFQSEDNTRELTYLKPYLPEMMTKDQIWLVVQGIIVGGTSNIGAIMKEFNSFYQGKADNKVVSEIAKEILSKK